MKILDHSLTKAPSPDSLEDAPLASLLFAPPDLPTPSKAISLPSNVEKTEALKPLLENQETIPVRGNTAFGSQRILIVEDNEELASYIGTVLAPSYQYVIAGNASDALAVLQKWPPDLILSDVMMPEMDGFTLCREIKARSETSLTPVILLTALADRDSLLKGWEMGADEFLLKPFHPQELVARINSILRMASMREEMEHRRNRYEELEEFTHVASHDLREPLRQVITYAQILDRDIASSKSVSLETKQCAQFISEGAARMSQLLEGLSTWIAAETDEPIFEVVQSEQVLELALSNLKVALETSRAKISHGPLPQLKASSSGLRQVLENLIRNSLTYCNRTEPQIHVQAEKIGKEWIFSVRDNGIGFESKYREKIFLIFERLHDQTTYPGIGLGLPLCRRIIKNHGGRIWAESEPGKGSVFYFSIPFHEISKRSAPPVNEQAMH